MAEIPNDEHGPNPEWFVEDTPDYYVNQMSVQASAYDLVITWGRRSADGRVEPEVRTTMSLEHAAVATAILSRLLKRHFSATGQRPFLPEELLRELGLKEEDMPWSQ